MNEESIILVNPNTNFSYFNKLKRYELFVFILGSIGLVLLCSLAVYSLAEKPNFKEEGPIFSIIIIISTIFTFSYLFRGIFEERPYELMVYVVAAICLTFYIIIDFIQNFDKVHTQTQRTLSYVDLSVAVIVMPMTAVFSSLLAYNYNIRGHTIFRTIEGSERLQDDCKNLYVFQALLQFDFQFELSLIVLILAVSVEVGKVQYFTLVFGALGSTIWHGIGLVSMRVESMWAAGIFMVLGFVEPAYAIFIIYNAICSIQNAMSEPIINPVTPVVSITFAVCFIAIIIRALLLIMSVTVAKKFGNGLKDRLGKFCCEGEGTGEHQPLVSDTSLLS